MRQVVAQLFNIVPSSVVDVEQLLFLLLELRLQAKVRFLRGAKHYANKIPKFPLKLRGKLGAN